MNKTKSSEKDLLKDLTNQSANADELATTSEKNWVSYSKYTDKADDDFLTQRNDVFDTFQPEFEEDEKDSDLIKLREDQPEIGADIDDL